MTSIVSSVDRNMMHAMGSLTELQSMYDPPVLVGDTYATTKHPLYQGSV